MKFDWQHVAIILTATASALGPFVTQYAQHKPVDPGLLTAAVVALVTTLGALLKPSVLPSVTEAAAVKNATEQVLK